jgi:tape measure domain-containing protein
MANGKSTILTIKIIGDSSKATAAMDKASGSVSKFHTKSAAVMGAVAGVFSSFTTKAINYVSGLAGEMSEASDSADKFGSTLKFGGVDDSTIKKLTSSTQEYADKTVFSLSDIRNTTAQLAANGVKGYSSLAEAAGNLTAVSGGNADAFKSVGMVLTQTAAQGKLTTENWNQLSDAIPGGAGKLQQALLESNAYTGNFRDAMAKGEISADEFNDALMKLGMTDVAKKAAASTKTMEGASGNLEAAVVKVGSTVIDKLKPMITDAMSGAADAVSGLADKVGPGIDAIGNAFNTLQDSGMLVPILSGIGSVIMVAVAPALWSMATAAAASAIALLANPFTWIALGVGALVVGIVALVTHWNEVTAAVGGFVSNAGNALKGFFSWIGSAIMNFISSGWGQAILMVFMPVLGIPNLIYQHWGQITSFFSNIGNAIVGFFRGIPGAIRGFFNAAYNFATGAWNGAVGAFNSIKSGIINVFSSIGNAISAPFKAAFNGIRSLWNSTVGGFGFDIPSWIPGIGGKSFKIPMLANGGILRTAGTVLVGEAGPEFLNLPAGASVTPLDKAQAKHTQVTNNYNITIEGKVLDPRGTALTIRKMLKDLERQTV